MQAILNAPLGCAQVCMNIDPKEKMINMAERPDGRHARMEKYVLRKAFDDPEDPYLPESVLWRQKEQFSDGVGYSWVDSLKKYAEHVRPDTLPAALLQIAQPSLKGVR